MPVETADDLALFLDANEFGAEAVYQTQSGASAPVTGILDRPHMSATMDGADLSETRPTFCCQAAALPAGARGGYGDTLTLNGKTYGVKEHQPDGQGLVLLHLGS